jgi:hypothetical protein
VADVKKQREKVLASDHRAGIWARSTARNRQRFFVRKNWRILVSIAAAMGGLFAVITLFVPEGFQRGFVVGVAAASTVAALHTFVLLFSGTATTIMGDLAEQWTAQELRPLTAHGWKLVNHFGLAYGDNDHVLVGPGGVVLFETKWNGDEWKSAERDGRIQSALLQARDGGHQLARWHGLRKHGVSNVDTVVVLWGRQQDGSALLSGGRRDAQGTLVIHGKDVKDWALRQRRDRLTDQQINGIWSEMERHLQGRDALEQNRNPLPRSMRDLVLTTLGCLFVATCAIVASADVLKYSGSLLAWASFTGVAVAGGLIVRRSKPCRVLANSWLVGSSLTPILVGCAVAWTYLS